MTGDADCHKTDLAGSRFGVQIDLADFAAFAADYGLTEPDLTGDLDGNGTCDPADLQWLVEYWQCDCYTACP